jgi:hypothetical protein
MLGPLPAAVPTCGCVRVVASALQGRSDPDHRSESFAGSIPAASIPDRSPLRLASQHDDFGRIIFTISRREPTPAKPASAACPDLPDAGEL